MQTTSNFLSLPWLKRSASADDERQQPPASPLPPVVAASQSADTLESPLVADQQQFIVVANHTAPTTPVGLKPRPRAESLRATLGIPIATTDSRIPALPPRHGQNVFASPPVSTSSFYSRCGHDGIARSPDLVPGQARTAVGAIVAMQQRPFATARSISTAAPTQWNLPADDSIDENEEPRYYSLSDPIQNARTPMRVAHAAQALPDSPISPSSSCLAGSPSSRVFRRERKLEDDKNTSFSSQVHLMKNKGDRYDFAPIVATDEESHDDDGQFADVSAMSYSASEQHQQHPALDGALRRTKAKSQRKAKQDLILLVANRLRDDLTVLTDVEAVNELGCDDWFLRTPQDQEGLLTGFSEERRDLILQQLACILKEMNTAQPEEFFLSPSALPQYSEPHDELRQAILFCQSLVEQAVPQTDRLHVGQWTFQSDARSSLGLIPPESPDVTRGGDTSLFSLPTEAETPMTSNLSVGTSITSTVNSPMRGGNRLKVPHVNGLMMRRTIEIFSTLMQRLSMSCLSVCAGHDQGEQSHQWNLSIQESIQITESIKRTYFQLIAMESGHLRSLVDAFQYDLKPLGLTREEGTFVLPPPPPEMQFSEEDEADEISPPPTPPANNGEPDFMSPNTEDMRTIVFPQQQPDDDLRRTVGSMDYDDDIMEEREGPPSEILHPELLLLD